MGEGGEIKRGSSEEIHFHTHDHGQEENTLIFFLGDNGAPLGRKGDGSINQPMRGNKGMVSEGCIVKLGELLARSYLEHPCGGTKRSTVSCQLQL